MGKNIVILSDGTGQEGGKKNNTNVYNMFNMLEDRTERQVVFYDPGLGTGLRKITGNVGGMGISKNIRQAYAFLVENYRDGDSIYLVGFSRGAATVRSLSSFIHHFGILPRSRPELIKRAYRIYKNAGAADIDRSASEFVDKHHTMWATIKVLGCYDTVAALGLPWPAASAVLDGFPGFRHRFHNMSLSPSVENAFQALAIDDERKTFLPLLWDADCRPYQNIHQVWFTGMHTDVGGGYRERGLSDIALVWLTDQMVSHGLLIYRKHGVSIKENEKDVMHDSQGKFWQRAYRNEVRSWDSTRSDEPIVHQSVFDRIEAGPKLPGGKSYQPWIADVDPAREPWGRYEDRSWYVPDQ